MGRRYRCIKERSWEDTVFMQACQGPGSHLSVRVKVTVVPRTTYWHEGSGCCFCFGIHLRCLELKTTFSLKCSSKSVFRGFFLCYLMSLYKVFKHCPVWPVIRMISACPTEVQAVSSHQEDVLRWPLPVWVSMLLHKAFLDSAKILQQIFLFSGQIMCCGAGTFLILGGQKLL